MDEGHQRIALLKDISDKVAARVLSHGVTKDVADSIGADIATYLADDWGGQNLYIPQDLSSKLCARNAEMFAKFSGDNVSALAAEFGLSVQTVYRIVKIEREKRAPIHGDLISFT